MTAKYIIISHLAPKPDEQDLAGRTAAVHAFVDALARELARHPRLADLRLDPPRDAGTCAHYVCALDVSLPADHAARETRERETQALVADVHAWITRHPLVAGCAVHRLILAQPGEPDFAVNPT